MGNQPTETERTTGLFKLNMADYGLWVSDPNRDGKIEASEISAVKETLEQYLSTEKLSCNEQTASSAFVCDALEALKGIRSDYRYILDVPNIPNLAAQFKNYSFENQRFLVEALLTPTQRIAAGGNSTALRMGIFEPKSLSSEEIYLATQTLFLRDSSDSSLLADMLIARARDEASGTHIDMRFSDDQRYQCIDLPSTAAAEGVDPMGNPDIYLTASAEPILHAGLQVWSNPILDIDKALQRAGIREVQEDPASMHLSYYRGDQRLDPLDANLAIYREIFWQEVAAKNRNGVFIAGAWIGNQELPTNMRMWFDENSHLAPVGIDFETCIVRCYNTTSGQIERYRFDVTGQVYQVVEVVPRVSEKPEVPEESAEGIDAELLFPRRTSVCVQGDTLNV